MLLKYSLVYTLLVGAAVAGCDKQQQPLRALPAPFTGENKLDLVPLNETATTGVVPIDVEQTILRLGNRFANGFYANISADGELGSCFSCPSTILKEMPCIKNFLRTKNPADLFKCGVTKADLCKCVDCIPIEVIKDLIKKYACKSKEDGEVEDAYNYATFFHLAEQDLNLQAFLGTAKIYHLEQNEELGCPIGKPCGSCQCCVGECVFDTCIGFCR